MHASTAIVNAAAALERASGLLDGLGRPEDASRCSLAAADLRSTFVDELERDENYDEEEVE